jgi:integrase
LARSYYTRFGKPTGEHAGLKKGRTTSRETPPVARVADDTVKRTLADASPLVRGVVRVMRLTGARPGEVTTMTVEQIDRSNTTCWLSRVAAYFAPKRKQSMATTRKKKSTMARVATEAALERKYEAEEKAKQLAVLGPWRKRLWGWIEAQPDMIHRCRIIFRRWFFLAHAGT